MGRPYAGGQNLQERLRTKLEGWCDIIEDPVYDHQYKLDLIVTRFKEIQKLPPQIGLQVTVRDHDVMKQVNFLRIQREAGVVLKSVYLEVDANASVDGVAAVVYAALVSLAFDKVQQDREMPVGLRVTPGFSFEFFDLEENVARLQGGKRASEGVAKQPHTSRRETREGHIIRYQGASKRFGFIAGTTPPRNFFFHLNNVDPELAKLLSEEVRDSPGELRNDMYIPVTFEDGGFTREGTRNPEAFQVRFHLHSS